MTDEFGAPTDLVEFEPGNDRLVFSPNLSHAPGFYTLRLRAKLENYSWVSTFEEFVVEVTACQTQIFSNLVSIPDMSNIWYSSPQPYDVGPILSQYYQEPNCQYTIDITMYQLVGQNYANMPIEVEYQPNFQRVVVSKCNVDSPAGDSECLPDYVPYEKNF